MLKAFASFGFCKAHAAAFALPTYQSAWLKAHHPAAFLAGVLTHDPGMYPKRLILDDARQFGIAVLPLDVNAPTRPTASSGSSSRSTPPEPRRAAERRLAAGRRAYGIRLALSEVKGISEAEVARIVAGRPYGSLSDFWHRAGVSRPVVERLVLAGAFDALYALRSGRPARPRRRGRLTRRDLLLQVARARPVDPRGGARPVGRPVPRTPAAARPGGRTDIAVAAASGESLTTVAAAGRARARGPPVAGRPAGRGRAGAARPRPRRRPRLGRCPAGCRR